MDVGGLLTDDGGNRACKPTELNLDAVVRGFVSPAADRHPIPRYVVPGTTN
jgi:hypothetical protein